AANGMLMSKTRVMPNLHFQHSLLPDRPGLTRRFGGPQMVSHSLGDRLTGAILEVNELSIRIDFKKHVLPVRSHAKINAAEFEPESFHEGEDFCLQCRRQVMWTAGDFGHPRPVVNTLKMLDVELSGENFLSDHG